MFQAIFKTCFFQVVTHMWSVIDPHTQLGQCPNSHRLLVLKASLIKTFFIAVSHSAVQSEYVFKNPNIDLPLCRIYSRSIMQIRGLNTVQQFIVDQIALGKMFSYSCCNQLNYRKMLSISIKWKYKAKAIMVWLCFPHVK